LTYMLLTLTICLTMVGVSEAPGTATVSQEPAWNYERFDTEFTINLTVTDAEDIQGWEANITFDPTVLEVVNASEGEFLKSMFPTFYSYLAPEDAGYIYIASSYYYVMPQGFGVNGNGILANITFQVITTEGNTSLHYKEAETVLWYNNGTALDQQPRNLNDGFVQVRIPGDANGDRTVDIFDIGKISSHWYPGPPIGPLGYDEEADINLDGNVDIFDIGICSAHWGETV